MSELGLDAKKFAPSLLACDSFHVTLLRSRSGPREFGEHWWILEVENIQQKGFEKHTWSIVCAYCGNVKMVHRAQGCD